MLRSYSELLTLPTFEERFQYLQLDGAVGLETFGYDRWMNQQFYRSKEWKRIRDEVIIRDNGCDLGVEGYEINSRIIIHHMNPMQKTTLKNLNLKSNLFNDLLNPEYLICVSHRTHNAIHYGDESQIPKGPAERKPNDTCPWR